MAASMGAPPEPICATPAAMFMPAICFMICSLLSASCTLRSGFSFMITVSDRPLGWGSSSASSAFFRRFPPLSSGFASG